MRFGEAKASQRFLWDTFAFLYAMEVEKNVCDIDLRTPGCVGSILYGYADEDAVTRA